MKIKIADSNPKVFISEVVGGLVLSYIGNSLGNGLIGSGIGTLGSLFFLVGVGNIIYFLYTKIRKVKSEDKKS